MQPSNIPSGSHTFIQPRISFLLELNPTLPKPHDKKSSNHNDDDDSFEFHTGGELQRTADELFDSGRIKPLKPPSPASGLTESPEPPSDGKNQIVLSPQDKKRDSMETEVTELYVLSPHGKQNPMSQENRNERMEERERRRERTNELLALSRKQRGTRSLSPFKDGESCRKLSDPLPASKAKDSSFNKKWKLRDLWLKKSNEEEVLKGGARILSCTGLHVKTQFTNTQRLLSRIPESGGGDVKESSFGSTESGVGGGVRRRGAAEAVSAHERHYTAKKAAAEETRRKTVLPYKHGLLGCHGVQLRPGCS